MTKLEAIRTVNEYAQLNIANCVHFANINSTKDVWWFDIPLAKFNNDLHLLLNKEDGFIWLKIPANTFASLDEVFRIKDKWVDLEISSNENNNYMVDIKSGGTLHNFSQYIEHEFN